jgi:DnaJ-class molecular chaperone
MLADWVADKPGRTVLTPEQIDTAWAILQNCNKSLSTNKNWRITVEHILKPLGIERCEGCGGRGIIQHLETPLEPDDDYGWNQKCPDCDGRR